MSVAAPQLGCDVTDCRARRGGDLRCARGVRDRGAIAERPDVRRLAVSIAVALLAASSTGVRLESQDPGASRHAAGSAPPLRRRRSRPAPAPRPSKIPVLTLIADSDRHFKAGQKELELGHVEARQAGVRPRDRPAARVALRRPDRAAHPRALRSAGRSHQHLRSEGARRGRRLHREEVRAGVDRRAAGAVDDVRHAAAGARADETRFSRICRRPAHDIRSRSTSGCCPTSSCSRAGCTTSSRKA